MDADAKSMPKAVWEIVAVSFFWIIFLAVRSISEQGTPGLLAAIAAS